MGNDNELKRILPSCAFCQEPGTYQCSACQTSEPSVKTRLCQQHVWQLYRVGKPMATLCYACFQIKQAEELRLLKG